MCYWLPSQWQKGYVLGYTTLADKLLSHSSNVEMCCTTKTKVHGTLSFQQFGQKIGTCSLHTGAPHFRPANLVLFRCDEPQIWQRFLAVSGPWTCVSCRWRQIRKCIVDGGPHGGKQHRVALVGHVALVTARHFTSFSRIKAPARTCAFKNLWRGSEMQALAFFKIPRCWMTTTGIHFVYEQNITSFAVKSQFASFPREITEQKGFRLLARITEHWNDSNGSNLLLVNNVLKDLPNQRAWYHMNMSKCFCCRQAKLALTSFLLEHFKCTLPTPGKMPLTWYVQYVQTGLVD